MTKKAAVQDDEIAHEDEIEATMITCREIAKASFGDRWNRHAVTEIYDYLKEADSGGIAQFKIDLARQIGRAQRVFETVTPTPEDVFFIFSANIEDDEDDE